MVKKIIALVLCTVLLIPVMGFNVKASENCDLDSGDYHGHGSCSLTATTGYAETFVDPRANTTVSADYAYNKNYASAYATTGYKHASSGGEGGCWVHFSVPDSSLDRSLNINAEHSFSSNPAGYSASGITNKVY